MLSDDKARKGGNGSLGGATASPATPDLDALLQAGRTWLEMWVAVSGEILDFSRDRINRQIEISQAIASSPNPYAAIRLQSEFASSALADCIRTGSRIADLGARATVSTLPNGRH